MHIQKTDFIAWWIFCLVIFISTSVSAANDKTYAITIASSTRAFTSADLPEIKLASGQYFYAIKTEQNKQLWNRLKLGFFENQAEAGKTLTDIKKSHPDAFIGKVSKSEIIASRNSQITKAIYPAEYLLVSAADILMTAASAIQLPQKKSATGPVETEEPDYYFVINLKTASDLSEFERIRKHPLVAKHALYISELEIDNRTWYQYRSGFFTERKQAELLISNLSRQFPLARLIRITKDEKQAATIKIQAFNATVTPKTTAPLKAAPSTNADSIYLGLVKKGTTALSSKDYTTAINSFSELLSYPQNRFTMDAQELLGFSYELNKQIADAKKIYEQYISLYPESSGTIRVRQRLASLITARKETPKELREAKKISIEPKWETYGSISQFYRRDTSSLDVSTETAVTTINITDKRVNLSEIDTILSLNSRRRSNDYDIRTRFTGGHSYNLLDSNSGNKAPLSELYVDVLDINNKLNGRLGRQSSSKGGVLGRFDGLDAGYQVSDWFKINLTTGYQVTSVYHSADTDTFFNGIRADFGTFMNAWDFSIYYIKQNECDIVGREAVGTEFRYFHPGQSLFGLIDHDIKFDITNTILLNGTWTLANQTSINATIDIRQSPILTARNALQGQTFTSINQMLTSFTEDEILQIAMDRTAETKTIILGVSHPLSEQYTLNADLTATRYSATTASAGVEATPATGTDYYFNTQLVGTSIFKQNDTNITGLSYSQTSTSDTLSLLWNYRIPVTQNFRLNPRLSLARRDNSNDTQQSIYGTALKMDYRWGRNTSLEFEFGLETSNRTLVSGEENNEVYFLNLGYQHSF